VSAGDTPREILSSRTLARIAQIAMPAHTSA
jgi:hypothetical protein